MTMHVQIQDCFFFFFLLINIYLMSHVDSTVTLPFQFSFETATIVVILARNCFKYYTMVF